jgi:hypothetical protein
MLGGYTAPSIPRWFPRTAWTIIVAVGLTITFWRRRERSELSFWLFMWLGLLTSAPLVIFADGWRALSSILPLVAVFFSCGFTTQADVSSSVIPVGDRTSRLALAAVLVTMSLWVAIPGLAHWLDPLGADAFKTVPPRPGERVVLGSKYMAGFVVVPDDSAVPKEVPSMRRSQFTTAFEYSLHTAYKKLPLPPPSTSFAFIVAPNANGTNGTLFAAPAEVFIRRNVPAWRLTLETEIQEEEDVSFARVTTATPLEGAAR